MSIVRRARARPTTSSRSDPTVRKAAVERQPTLSAARAEPVRGAQGFDARLRAQGFALIEILCVLAIIGLLAAIILPAIPRSTTRAKLESYAVRDRGAAEIRPQRALRRQVRVATQVDARGARRSAPASPGRPSACRATWSCRRCWRRAAPIARRGGRSISFRRACRAAATIALARPGMGYEVRVNWLTGGVEIVPQKLL